MSPARDLWQFGEPLHAVVYYAPECRAATDGLGMKGGWMSYFAIRTAPLGAAAPAVAAAALYAFHPAMVGRALPDAWSYATPAAVLDARVGAVDAMLRRVLGADVETPGVARAAELASSAVARTDMSGRTMGSANQTVSVDGPPWVRLWQALTTIREHRGDGHVNRLVDAGIAPCEALVLQAGTGRSPEDGLRSHRGWSAQDWDHAGASLLARGLLDDAGRVTAAGTALRGEIEAGTDRLAAPVAVALGEDGVAELVALLRPLAEAVMAAEVVPAHNNMGVPWPPPTAGETS